MSVTVSPKGTREAPPEPAPKKIKRWLPPVITLVTALFTLFAGASLFMMYGYKQIYPNVYYADINLGGMTESEAEAVIREYAEPSVAAARLEVSGSGFSHAFTAEEVGAAYVSGGASAAMNAGREGSFLKRAGDMWSAILGRADLGADWGISTNRDAVAGVINDLARDFDTERSDFSYEILADAVKINVGRKGFKLDRAKLAEIVINSFETLEFSEKPAPVEISAPEEPDAPSIREKLYREKANAALDISDPENPVVIPSQTGLDMDAAALAERIKDAERSGISSFSAPITITEPDTDTETFRRNLFRDTLSSFTTTFQTSNVPRTSNLRLASDAVNGIILLPGDTFSYNDALGQRTPARGYQEAGAYVNGKLVPEFGGGICQLSSTMYNAVLNADLEIAERRNHGMTVSYVPLGLDATVNWGTTDFKFTNDKSYPVQIFAVMSGNRLTVTILGTNTDGTYVKMEHNTLSTTPFAVTEKANPALAPGTRVTVQDGHNGAVAETYRNVYDADGNLLSRTFEAKSTYTRTDKLVEVGPAVITVSEATPAPAAEPEPDFGGDYDVSA